MSSIVLQLFFALLISFLITFYLVPFMLHVAHTVGIVDVPDGKIKKHEKTTPYLGGVAIYIGFITAVALTYPFNNNILFFLLGATLLLFVGLIDDLIMMKPYQKFAGQIIASLCFLKAGLHLRETFFLNNYWNIPLSLFWMLSIINAFNLVDVMDGLATSLSFFAAFSFLCIAIALQQLDVALLLAAFIGPLIAFFWYNQPPAHIYMGDAGSLFIGGFLATIPFLLKWSAYNWYAFVMPLAILAIPLLEVGALIIIRSWKGIPFYKGSPDHFSIYLKANGWTTWEILGYISILSSILIIIPLLFVLNKISVTYVIICGLAFLSCWGVALVYKRK